MVLSTYRRGEGEKGEGGIRGTSLSLSLSLSQQAVLFFTKLYIIPQFNASAAISGTFQSRKQTIEHDAILQNSMHTTQFTLKQVYNHMFSICNIKIGNG